MTFVSNNCKYQIINPSEVRFTGITSANTTSVKIPATVKNGVTTFKVISIQSGALQNHRKIKMVTVGENVSRIGVSAFHGCKNLKTIVIKSTKLKTVGKDALRNINNRAVIKVPKDKLTSYKKLFKNKGQGSGVKMIESKG